MPVGVWFESSCRVGAKLSTTAIENYTQAQNPSRAGKSRAGSKTVLQKGGMLRRQSERSRNKIDSRKEEFLELI